MPRGQIDHMSKIKTEQQVHKLEGELALLRKNIEKSKVKVGRFASSIPGVDGSNGLLGEQQDMLEALQAEHDWKLKKLAELQARLAKNGTPGSFEEVEEMAPDEARSVCQLAFENLIREKDENSKLCKQLKTIQGDVSQRGKENAVLRKRLSEQRSAAMEGIESAELRETKSAALFRSEQEKFEELSQELQKLRAHAEAYGEQEDERLAQISQLQMQLEVARKEKEEVSRDVKASQARLKMYTEGGKASSGLSEGEAGKKLEESVRETQEAWLQLDELETKCKAIREEMSEVEEELDYEKKQKAEALEEVDSMMNRVDKLQMENLKLNKKLEFEKTKTGNQRKRSLGSADALGSPITEVA